MAIKSLEGIVDLFAGCLVPGLLNRILVIVLSTNTRIRTSNHTFHENLKEQHHTGRYAC